MNKELYRYTFSPHVPLEEIEATLLLALWGAESLHGGTPVRLEAAHAIDADQRACVIDASTPVGRDLNRFFIGFVNREFGPDACEVKRVDSAPVQKPEEVAA